MKERKDIACWNARQKETVRLDFTGPGTGFRTGQPYTAEELNSGCLYRRNS